MWQRLGRDTAGRRVEVVDLLRGVRGVAVCSLLLRRTELRGVLFRLLRCGVAERFGEIRFGGFVARDLRRDVGDILVDVFGLCERILDGDIGIDRRSWLFETLRPEAASARRARWRRPSPGAAGEPRPWSVPVPLAG